jgi:TRAP-type mannitol/chloroaromatic compound transport system substrate-binding protein
MGNQGMDQKTDVNDPTKDNQAAKTPTRREFLGQVARGAGSVAAGGVIGATIGAPAVHAQKKFQWKMVTTWPKNFPGLGTGADAMAEMIGKASNGRLTVKVYGAGELIPALGTFDAVSRGTAQMGHSAAYYWKGKHPACQFFAAVPFGMNAQEMNAWLEFGGGQALWDEVYRPFGVRSFNAGNSGVQMGGWFNKQIRKTEDLKGLKIRIPGLGAEVMRKMGSTVVTIPGGELFQALKSGAIDASEWVGPYNDLAFGLYKAAKYYYWPGWHEPGSTMEAMVNIEAYNQLPTDLQEIVRVSAQAAGARMLNEFTARNQLALKQMVDRHKVQVRQFPEEVLTAMGRSTKSVLAELAAKDALTKKVHRSYTKFLNASLKWNRISEQGYSAARAKAIG